MNMQAAFKALLVVVAIGGITGFDEWRRTYGGTPEEQTQRAIAKCVKEREGQDYRANPLAMSGQNKQDIQSSCEDFVRGGLVLGAPASGTAPANGTPARTAATHKPQHASNQPQGRLERCLARIEEARKRSPGGLNPEWEKGERQRCEAQ